LTVKSKRAYKKAKKRVGRGLGSGHGKTACRGYKGQYSRTGSNKTPGFEGGQMPLIRRLPKRGFNNTEFQATVEIVNLVTLNRLTEKEITPDLLVKQGIIKGDFDRIKVLGKGTLEKAITVHAHSFSKKAQSEIEKKGGKVVIVTCTGTYLDKHV
jgi:large subunit ribosomal protein L15